MKENLNRWDDITFDCSVKATTAVYTMMIMMMTMLALMVSMIETSSYDDVRATTMTMFSDRAVETARASPTRARRLVPLYDTADSDV